MRSEVWEWVPWRFGLQSFYAEIEHLRSICFQGSLTEVMASSYVFFIFWSAHVFYLLSTQGTAVEELKRVQVYNETDEATLKMMFKKYVQTHNRTYLNDPEEYNRRLSVFKVVPCLIALQEK